MTPDDKCARCTEAADAFDAQQAEIERLTANRAALAARVEGLRHSLSWAMDTLRRVDIGNQFTIEESLRNCAEAGKARSALASGAGVSAASPPTKEKP